MAGTVRIYGIPGSINQALVITVDKRKEWQIATGNPIDNTLHHSCDNNAFR